MFGANKIEMWPKRGDDALQVGVILSSGRIKRSLDANIKQEVRGGEKKKIHIFSQDMHRN